jgi:uncharacterized membrane protein YheB (UPF0754 family)
MINKSFGTNLIALLLILIGYFSPLYGEEIKTMGLYSFSGAITNWLAIHMLFEKVPFLYGSGIVTERFEEFKDGIRNLMLNQFFTEENLQKFVSQSSAQLKLDGESIAASVDFERIFTKLKQAIIESPFGGMLGMLGGEQALEPLKPAFEVKFKEEISLMINDENFIKQLSLGNSSTSPSSLGDKVKEIVNGRLAELTPEMVKIIIQEMIKVHLGWLVVWGGVFGALIGLATTLL